MYRRTDLELIRSGQWSRVGPKHYRHESGAEGPTPGATPGPNLKAPAYEQPPSTALALIGMVGYWPWSTHSRPEARPQPKGDVTLDPDATLQMLREALAPLNEAAEGDSNDAEISAGHEVAEYAQALDEWLLSGPGLGMGAR